MRTAEFVKAAVKPIHFPPGDYPEIAFAGRSNVGKSSLINSLCQRKKLVKVSRTPGRTQTLNFFLINEILSLVDLPGYGYAKVSKTERNSWGPMVENYFYNRDSLLAVVCICDARRGIQESDKMLIESAPLFGWQPIIVFTKADKFKTNALAKRRRELAVVMSCKPEEVLLYSSMTKLGRDQIWDRIKAIAGIDDEGKKKE